jgi:CBS domain-containing protein
MADPNLQHSPLPNGTPSPDREPVPPVAYFFLSELLGKPVRAETEVRPIGRVEDIGASNNGNYPVAVSLVVKPRRGPLRHLPWTSVLSIAKGGVTVKQNGAPAPVADFHLRHDVLDDQVIDVHGAKVIRVNDIHLVYTQGQLVLGHVDVGMLGLLRRLGFAKIACALLRWLLDYELPERFVTWRHIHVMSPGALRAGLRLSSALTLLADKHPADIADIVEDLGVSEGHDLLRSLPVETAADAFEELEDNVQRALISQEEPWRAADILEEIPASEAATVLRDIHDADAERIISRMESEAAEDVRAVLSHEEETAGGIMAPDCIEARPDERAGALLDRVRLLSDEVEVFYYVHVLDEDRRLIGVLSLRELLCAPPDAAIRDLMETDLVTVRPEARHRDVAVILLKYGLRSVPVVDALGLFLGAVRIFTVAESLLPDLRE